MADKVKFRELLGMHRTRCGWSQNELGMKIGVHRNTIASWENGDRSPQSRGEVLRLAEELLLSKEERQAFLKAAGLSIEHWPADYWNVPYLRNPYFVGREAVLQSLRQTLVPGAKSTALTQSIGGLGGIGKTQVAVEYAHRYGEHYEAVLWISADSQEIATAAYLQLATQVLGLPEQQEAEQQIAEVKRWLQKRHGWLLILDNVEDPQAILSTFVPSKHQGSVLITTRRRDVGALARSEMLPLFSEDDAVLFLLRRAKRVARKASVTEATSDDFLLARDLCQLLDQLPLAIDQAGAYIAENGCSLQHYIDLYHTFRPTLLDRRNADDQSGRRTGSNHPDSVLMTFWLSWDQVQAQNALAGKALQFSAFLAPEQIPEQLVWAGITHAETESTRDALEMDEALGLLYRYSLIERTEQTLSLHRLVQEVLQEVLSEAERHYWMERAVLVVNAVFPSGKHGTWSLCEFLLPHALICAKWTIVLRQKKPEAVHLLRDIGGYLYERAQYAEAEPLLQRALAIAEEQVGASHPETATGLSNLALLYHQQGRYAEAEPLLQRALAIAEEQVGASHPETATDLNNLATLYQTQGRYTEAEPLLQRALTIAEEQLGASHLATATSLDNLAGLYYQQGRYAEAEPLLQRVLLIREEQLETSHPAAATSLNNLAELYRTQGRYPEAEPLLQRALLIREEQLGTSHPAAATSLNSLALLYYQQGRYAEAEPLYQRALFIREEQLGASHPATAQCLNNLAGLHESQGRYAEAEPLYQRALSINEEQLGASHPETAASLNNLAGLHKSQGRYAEAEPLYQRALAIAEEQLGASHPHTAACLNNLAELYQAQGRYAEAEPLLQRTLTIAEERLGASHPQTAACLNNLAFLYESQGRYEEAEPLYRRAVTVALASLGMEHPQTQQVVMNYLMLLSDRYTNGDMDALLRLLRQREQDDNIVGESS